MMKLARMVAILLVCSGSAFGQADAKPQSKCRPLLSGDFIGSNESIVGSGANMMVCSQPAKVEAIQPAIVQPAKVQPAVVQPEALATASATPALAVAGVGPSGDPRVTPGAAPRVQFAAGYQYDSI